jgi:hypothetical protein
VPNVKTTQELVDLRKSAYKTDVHNKMHEFEKHVKIVNAQVSRVPDEGYVENPRYTSIN